MAAGAALYEIMSDLVFRTTSTDRTVIEARDRGAREVHGMRPRRGRGPGRRRAHLSQAADRRARPRPQADAARAARARRSA